MRLSLDALLVLDAIERRGSFAAAAEELHRVPSALSYTIQKLEEDLEVVIFDRSGHRAKLTATGRTLLQEGRQLLIHAQTLQDRVHKLARGWESEVVIAVDDIIGPEALYPLIADFYAQKAPTRLRISVEVLGGGWDALLSRRADIVVGVPGNPPTSGGFTVRSLGTVDILFAVPSGHPLATAKEPVEEHHLAAYRTVTVAHSSRNSPPRGVDTPLEQNTFITPNVRAQIAAQVAGLGVGYVPRHLVINELANGSLKEVRVRESSPRRNLYLAWRAAEAGKATAWLSAQLVRARYPGVEPDAEVIPTAA